MQKIIDLGPELFMDGEALVISYKGENYYRACGKTVNVVNHGGTTTCVKRTNHPTQQCEDYYGNTREYVAAVDPSLPTMSNG